MLKPSCLRQSLPRAIVRGASRLPRLGAAALLAATVGCAGPPVDKQTPTPHGVITGSILYVGPRPLCDYDGMTPRRVRGRVLLTLVDDANPLPPQGTAERPVDFFAVGGEDLFTNLAADCRPLGSSPTEDTMTIQRSVAFRWREIPLAPGGEAGPQTVAYRISGFYDQEGDFNPLFAVQQTSTAGDIAGGVLQDPQATTPVLALTEFGSVTDNRGLGQIRENVTVTLGGRVVTEPPLFHVKAGAGSIDSASPIPNLPPVGFFAGMPAITLSLYSRDNAGGDRTVLDRTLGAMNLGGLVDYANPLRYAWYIKTIDQDNDGMPDSHPIFSEPPLQFAWRTPIVFLQRIRNAAEVASGVPAVALIPIVYPSSLGFSATEARYPDVTLAVPPLATVLLDPNDRACAVSYYADGSSSDIPLGGAARGNHFECQELPTGFYGANALGGLVAGGATSINDMADGTVSETGFDIQGGNFGQQVWRVPNELGLPTQVGQSYVVPEQSPLGAVLVYDANPGNIAGRPENVNADPSICDTGFSVPAMGQLPYPASTVPSTCCAPVAHLCGVPLCPYVTVQATHDATPRAVRGTPNRTITDENGVVRPNCLPFPMPSSCCPTN